MKHFSFNCLIFAIAMFVTSCNDDNITYKEIQWPETEINNGDVLRTDYNGQYRPQIHYTPVKNWINDPNGLVYVDGTYHLFYQYNPYGNAWGNISWGHATSKNLVTWEEQPVAIYNDDMGLIYSGSAVYDVNNTSGKGEGAIVALYTSSGTHQQQCMAFSSDGYTFTKYEGNPVMPNESESDFRDPKVFWYDEGGYWVMALTLGWKYTIQLWKSENLVDWTFLSNFTISNDNCKRGQWECPDLVRMKYNGQDKWVLIVSVSPGGPVLGSGTQYFIGDFDGTDFKIDNSFYSDNEYPLWLDYGLDNYAGVTWSNTPDNRIILIGWMNNWNYSGDLPTSPWKSAMTLPRELTLIDYEGKPILSNKVVNEIDEIAGEWKDVSGEELNVDGPYQLRLQFDLTSDGEFKLENEYGEYVDFSVNSSNRQLFTSRTSNSGEVGFSTKFAIPSIKAPFNTEGDVITLDIYVDNSSIEVFTENGSMAQTNLVFPKSIYNRFITKDMNVTAKVRSFRSIWK